MKHKRTLLCLFLQPEPESKRVDSTKTSGDIKKALDDELEFEADVQELEDKNDQRADFSESFCKKRKRACHVKFAKERMRHYCPKTCEYCGKAPAPPPCLSTQFGCCWDKSTPASAPIGSGRENCPPCKDKQSESFCNMFKGDCTDYHPERIKGRQIRSFCPKTCRMCGKHPQCVDHPKQQYNCPQFKADGLCKANEKHMRLWCPKTCGFCKPFEILQFVMPGKKKNTIYRKKRKRVFSGKRKQEQEHESNSEDLGPASSSSPEKLNRSFEKIDNNCPLLEVEREETITRAKGFQLGINKSTPTTSNDNPAVNCAYLNKRRACTLERVRVLCPYTCDACG
eukprot:gene10569-19301_t